MKIYIVRLLLMIALLLSWLTSSTIAHAAVVLYAKPAASGTGDCLSWANACTLQTALTSAASGDEIWAATGPHKPTTVETDRSATYQLKNGVAIYGGFAGTETARNQKDPAINLTVLSGDIDNNDSQTPIITDLTTVTGNTTNSYHVVIGATGATLDGFTITAGNANADDVFNPDGNGGGMLNNSGSSPMLTNLTFSGNSTTYYGGGMLNWNNSSPTLTNVTFRSNSADSDGGGMFNWNSSNPTLTNITFNDNSAVVGGGMYNFMSSNPTLINVTFSGNSATTQRGGGMYNYSSSPTLTNVTFSNNLAATIGGGMFNEVGSNPQIRNTIFWGNTAPGGGAQIYNSGSTPVVSDSVVQDGFAGTNIITTDPLLGTLGDYGGLTQTIPLLAGSSAIDTGNDGVCPTTDQRGVTRPQGAHCDIGTYEYLDTTAPIVTSITRLNSSPTNLASVSFTVTFSESVTGVDVSHFSLTTAGVSGASVTEVSYSGSVYIVTVNTGSGSGTLRLDVTDDDSILDMSGNPLGGTGTGNGNFTGGETYEVRFTQLYLPLVLRN